MFAVAEFLREALNHPQFPGDYEMKKIVRVVACVALLAAVGISTGCALGISAEKTSATKATKK